jgi:hypothetical protein
MQGPDETIHQTVRLRIMAALCALDAGERWLDFTPLKSLTGATDGNLGAHIDTLSRVGYVAVEKLFAGRKPKTNVAATVSGRAAFNAHVAFLRGVIGQ